ncbi:hypothetical protein JN00_0020 [Metamycoplasma subdolum]|uniref:Lipoprotein n=1 Tax=Metamycoplasma subdolum TaxID=92407 RepID=A0A3M0A2U8_9BACT|nr:hypothetical protein [Metamycoplasma subdolum]RMA78976.1 hypothetical protein JN00_0020 [Metamycoplasma subdolum]WPB50499.1 hypothetical protein R9C05_02730 [Metamycoplasma subdolum]
MNKKMSLFFSLLSLSFVPALTISCKKPEDWEDLNKLKPSDEIKVKKTFTFTSEEAKKIESIYFGVMKDLLTRVKNNWRDYKKDWNELKRNVVLFRNKIDRLIIQQSNLDDQKALQTFFDTWISTKSKGMKLTYDGQEHVNYFALFLLKYTLIYDDVAAVLNDVNLAFDAQGFLEDLKIVDDRLEGKDINLASLQKSLQNLWKFVNQHLYNPNKITKKEDLEHMEIGADKNSHTHSHAGVNLTYELGLWHEKLFETKKIKDSTNKTLFDYFLDDWKNVKKHIVINIDSLNYEVDFNRIVKNLTTIKSLESVTKIGDIKLRENGQKILDTIKVHILNIAKKYNIQDKLELK